MAYTKKRKYNRNSKGRKWKFKRKHAYKDYDKDGKVNRYDCKPLNKYKQDSRRKGKGSYLTEKTEGKKTYKSLYHYSRHNTRTRQRDELQ